MTTSTMEPPVQAIGDSVLLGSIVKSVESVMPMCGMQVRCVALSSVPCRDSDLVTGMIGVHGKSSGFVTVNAGESASCLVVEGLLGQKYDSLCADVIDGVGEMTNMIVGGIKSELATSDWAISRITVPSVIVGKGYNIAFSHGLTFASATFEFDNPEAIVLSDRLIHIGISLLRT